MEYCSTVPPLQQLAGGLPPPPAVMVPVGVLKREGSKHRTEGQKSVIFSDGNYYLQHINIIDVLKSFFPSFFFLINVNYF